MGLFKKLGSAIGKAASKIGERIGWTGLEIWGDNLQEKCRETSKAVSKTQRYDENSAGADQVSHLAEILSTFSSGLKAQGDLIEKAAKSEVENYFEKLFIVMDTTLDDKRVLKNLRSKKNMALSGIDNTFVSILARRVSLSDQECLSILKTPQGKKKEQAMDQFGRKVIQEGLENLCQNLDGIFREITSDLGEELNGLLDEQRKELEQYIHQLEQIELRRKDDAENTEQAMLIPAKALAAAELAIDTLNEGGVP